MKDRCSFAAINTPSSSLGGETDMPALTSLNKDWTSCTFKTILPVAFGQISM